MSSTDAKVDAKGMALLGVFAGKLEGSMDRFGDDLQPVFLALLGRFETIRFDYLVEQWKAEEEDWKEREAGLLQKIEDSKVSQVALETRIAKLCRDHSTDRRPLQDGALHGEPHRGRNDADPLPLESLKNNDRRRDRPESREDDGDDQRLAPVENEGIRGRRLDPERALEGDPETLAGIDMLPEDEEVPS